MFAIAVVDENGAATGAVPRLDVAPAVADNIAGGKIDVPALRSLDQQARLRLAAFAVSLVVVRADANVIQLQVVLQAHIYFRDLPGGDCASGDIGLVGDENERETGLAQLAARFADPG